MARELASSAATSCEKCRSVGRSRLLLCQVMARRQCGHPDSHELTPTKAAVSTVSPSFRCSSSDITCNARHGVARQGRAPTVTKQRAQRAGALLTLVCLASSTSTSPLSTCILGLDTLAHLLGKDWMIIPCNRPHTHVSGLAIQRTRDCLPTVLRPHLPTLHPR